MPGRPLTWVDVFTPTPLAGNALAVVHDADSLDDATMLAFARETRLSETTFVQASDDPGADYRNRIWMTTGELPFAGHPSLGTAVAVACVRGLGEASFVQQTEAGLQPIDVELAGLAAHASMLQEPARFGPELDADEVLGALGLPPGMAAPELPPQVVSTGLTQLVVPVVPAALPDVRPERAALADLLERHGAVVAYVAATDPDAGRARARSFFVEPQAVVEDPATGSAAGPLCAYVHRRAATERLDVEQGVEMGRPALLRCAVEGDRVRVAGDCVVVATGAVHL